MKNRISAFFFQFLIAHSVNSQQMQDTNVVVKTTQLTYSTDDLVSITLKGTIMSTGDCDGGPMFGIAMKKDSVWTNLVGVNQSQSCCGLPWLTGIGSGTKVNVFSIGSYYHNFSVGEYKLLFMSRTGRTIETNVFTITDAICSDKMRYKKEDTVTIEFNCRKGLGILVSTCTGVSYDLQYKTNTGAWTDMGIAFPCPGIYYSWTFYKEAGTFRVFTGRYGEFRVKVLKRKKAPNEKEIMIKRKQEDEEWWYSNSFFVE